MTEKLVFLLGNKLPLVSEAVHDVLTRAPGGSAHFKSESGLRRTIVTAYTNALLAQWTKAFGVKHVQTRKTVGEKLRKKLISYFNEVTCSKQKCKKSKRELVREWRSKNNELFDILKKSADPDMFEADEKAFYYGQKSSARTGYISDVVDIEYEEQQQEEIETEREEREAEDREHFMIFGGETIEETSTMMNSTAMDGMDNSSLDMSLNRSGRMRRTVSKQDRHVQTDPVNIERPEIRKVRNFTEEIKATCANVSTKCGISVEKARVAVQTTCKTLYKHNYYLTCEEQDANAPITTEVRDSGAKTTVNQDAGTTEMDCDETSEDYEPQYKRICNDADKNKFTNSKKEYEQKYKNVLPSRKVIIKYKEMQASQEERDAALALYQKSGDVRVTLHYDSTTRNCIDGEWPSLVLAFSDKQRFRLRPIFFAYEDRENIAYLIVESFCRLADSVSIHLNIVVVSKYLWEKTNNFMTDSVSKNLGVIDLVADMLKSEYKPHHILCKSHVVEKFDSCNINVLADLESRVNLQEKLIAINPSLKPFFRGKKAVVLSGIMAILKLVTYDKSANSCSLAEEFDYIVEREVQTKHMSLYHEAWIFGSFKCPCFTTVRDVVERDRKN